MKYAYAQIDGTHAFVFGIGDSPRAAERDVVESNNSGITSDELELCVISDAAAAAIQRGVIGFDVESGTHLPLISTFDESRD